MSDKNHLSHKNKLDLKFKKKSYFQSYCESMDAYLVEIESPEENTWIYQHVKSIPGKIFMETKITLHICIYLYIYFFLDSRFDFSWILQKAQFLLPSKRGQKRYIITV